MRWKMLDHERWYRWFAWYPVVAGGMWVWLETVERKVEICNEAGTFWEYRLLEPRSMCEVIEADE